MSWQHFEPMDLFGEGLGCPARVYRGALKGLWEDPASYAEGLRLEQLEAIMGGKRIMVPRLEAWWGERPYPFGGRVVQHRPHWPLGLTQVKELVEELVGERFDSCFVNFYRDGSDHIPWHADDAPWIVDSVASLSFGVTRPFQLRRKADHKAVVRGFLEHGDVLHMTRGCQAAWEHCVPKRPKLKGPRINLTFRRTQSPREDDRVS